MKKNKTSHPFDNLLLAYITKEGQDSYVSGNADKEADIVLKKKYPVVLADDKKESLLAALAGSLSKDTLGTLVVKGLRTSPVSVTELLATTGLTPTLLEAIGSDTVFTNSIPVRSLVKLMKMLGVSLEKAQSAIHATFEILSMENKMFLTEPAKAQPAFRKGMMDGAPDFDFKHLKPDERYLYQNKEALDKYLKRFAELFEEIL